MQLITFSMRLNVRILVVCNWVSVKHLFFNKKPLCGFTVKKTELCLPSSLLVTTMLPLPQSQWENRYFDPPWQGFRSFSSWPGYLHRFGPGHTVCRTATTTQHTSPWLGNRLPISCRCSGLLPPKLRQWHVGWSPSLSIPSTPVGLECSGHQAHFPASSLRPYYWRCRHPPLFSWSPRRRL